MVIAGLLFLFYHAHDYFITTYSSSCCRVVTIDLQKFFLDISILLNEIIVLFFEISCLFHLWYAFVACNVVILLVFILFSSHILFTFCSSTFWELSQTNTKLWMTYSSNVHPVQR